MPDYLHLEFVFNPFELTFYTGRGRQKGYGTRPRRVGGARSGRGRSRGGRAQAERRRNGAAAGDGGHGPGPQRANGHHVRLRAHYKVDARGLPLTVESDPAALTSASHLTQVTYVNGSRQQLAQLDSQSRKATFQAGAEAKSAAAQAAPQRRAAPGRALLAATVFLVLIGAAFGWVLWRRRIQLQISLRCTRPPPLNTES